jgi:hypothetical protein
MSKPYGWFVKDFADGWIFFAEEPTARSRGSDTGSLVLVAHPVDQEMFTREQMLAEVDRRLERALFANAALTAVETSTEQNEAKHGQLKIQNFDTRVSSETVEALKQVDADARMAAQNAARLIGEASTSSSDETERTSERKAP